MKCLKRVFSLLLSVLLLLSFCACSSEEEILYAKTTLAYEQSRYLDTGFNSVAIMHYKLKEGCRDKLNMMFFVSTHNDGLEQDQILVNDLYMLDLDSGNWYFDGVIDYDALNFETKENALMYFYNAFDRARTEDSTWFDSKYVDYLPVDEVSLINEMHELNAESKTLRVFDDNRVDLTLSPIRLFAIDEARNQPAGFVRDSINSVAEAITYLNLRFSTLSADSMAVDNGMTRILRSGIEILEEYQLPATRGDIATCVTYLLGDAFQIDTLVVFVTDDSGKDVYPLTINMLKLKDGYWFFDPVLLMNLPSESIGDGYLPEMMCDSVDSYIERIQQDFAITAVFKVSNGSRMDYEVVHNGGFSIKTDSACAELICSDPAA